MSQASTARVCIVSGATSGIGRACALELAATGAELHLIVRSPERGEATRREIVESTGNTAVHLVRGDFTSQAETRRAAAELLEACPRIDLLLNNAGVVHLRRTTTPDGIESTFAVNHLGYFLLTNLLLPRLKETPGAHVVSVASDAHKFGGAIDFDDLELESGYGWTRAYGRSKGANILFTRELARRLEGHDVRANCVHPGFVRSNLGANNGGIGRWIVRTAGIFAMSPERAARHILYVCNAPELADASGRYFAKSREITPARWARDDASARRLWEISERMTGLARAA